MSLEPTLLARLDVQRAIDEELKMPNRLMPRRADRAALASRSAEVQRLFRSRYNRDQFGDLADIVFVDKNRRGRRPISEMSLRDRVLFRALVNLIADSLPSGIVTRPPYEDFAGGPLDEFTTGYVSKTDITSFYEYVDHDRLADELEAQTGEAPAIDALMQLLHRIMGRRVGLPQVHKSSDILGDAYIDPVRRRMRRAGYDATTYSDDFRIASGSLADARQALETCAREARVLGLTLNEGKTFTYTAANYAEHLSSFRDAEKRLFEDSSVESGDLQLLFVGEYFDDSDDDAPSVKLPAGPASFPGTDDDDVLAASSDGEPTVLPPSAAQARAADRAWKVWFEEERHPDPELTSLEVSATVKLLQRALPILGRARNEEPLAMLSELLRREPALTPEVSAYIAGLGQWGPQVRGRIRRTLDTLVAEPNFSVWQQIWLADAARRINPVKGTTIHYEWLEERVSDAPPALAATAAAALGNLHHGDTAQLVAALDRVGPAWRTLALWGVARLNHSTADEAAEDRLEHILVEETPSWPSRTS